MLYIDRIARMLKDMTKKRVIERKLCTFSNKTKTKQQKLVKNKLGRNVLKNQEYYDKT